MEHRGVAIVGPVTEVYRSPEHLAASNLPVTVAIPFVSNRDTIRETLRSLQQQEGALPFELLLVSNGTQDDSIDVAKESARGLPTRIVSCPSVGYDANARNVSMAESTGAKVLFVDADDTVSARYVRAMSDALDHAAVVTGIWSLPRHNGARFPELLSRGATAKGWPFSRQGWTYAPAGTLGMRREVIDAVGGFDPDLLYAANNEWCFRAFAAGYAISAVPEAVVHYRLRPSARANLRQRYGWGVAEVAAAKAAYAYGLPRRSFARAAGAGSYYRLVKKLVTMRTPFDRFSFAGVLGHTIGHVVGSIRYRSLDL